MAVNDMAENGVTVTRDPETAALGERVRNLSTKQSDLETEMRNGFRSMESHIDRIATDTRAALSGLTQNLSDRNRPQWVVLLSALGFGFTVLVYFMTQAVGPVRETQVELKQSIAALAVETNNSIRTLAEKSVSREEMDWRSARGAEDRVRTEAAVSDIRSTMVTRQVWEEKNSSRDHDIENIRTALAILEANLQRQLDQQRNDFQSFSTSLGNGRDSFQDMKEEIRRLEERLDTMRMRRAAENSPPVIP
jgi:chromosome segregation ATPase